MMSIFFTAAISLFLLITPAYGQSSAEAARRFHARAKAEADKLRAQQSAKLKAYTDASRGRFQQMRKQLAEQYRNKPPLHDYARTDRPRVTTMGETVRQMNEELLQLRIDSSESSRLSWETSEERRLKDFTTQEDIRAREHGEKKIVHLQTEAAYWKKLEQMDVRVWADRTVYHQNGLCPFAAGGRQAFSHEVKGSRAYCVLCKPPVAEIDESLLPQRVDDPGEYVNGTFHPVAYSAPPPVKAKLKRPHKFSFGEAEYLERIRCSRKYDVYFAVINKQGMYQLAWFPANKMNRDDLMYIGRINLERKREREAMEEKIRNTPNP